MTTTRSRGGFFTYENGLLLILGISFGFASSTAMPPDSWAHINRDIPLTTRRSGS